jgi:glycosyltransferase involved in cell wall biosynthesis
MIRKRKIVHMTSVHRPSDVRIFGKECRSLAQVGYSVHLIVPGIERQTLDGVVLVPVPRPRNRFDRILRTTWAVFRKALALDADIYHFHDPELMPVGIMLSLRGKKVVYDVHEELANDILDKPWIWRPLRPLVAGAVKFFERFASRFYAGIVITRHSLFRNFRRRDTVLVHNYPILGELAAPGAGAFSERPPIAAFVGGATRERGLRELVEALALLPDDMPFELHIGGTIAPPAFLAELEALPGWRRVRYLGWLKRPEVAALLGKARCGIVTFLPIANHLESEPTKLFEYMSAGLPVIASNFAHWELLVRANGFGLLVDPHDPRAIADALRWVVQHPEEAESMGRRGQQAVVTQYNWDAELKKLVALYEGLT